METLTRKELSKKYNEIVEKNGKPKNGVIFCENQLFAKVASSLCAYDEANIIYENNEFKVSNDICVKATYANDHVFVGTVRVKQWFTSEQIKALHEVAFGYQF